jgi:hypothetical protein
MRHLSQEHEVDRRHLFHCRRLLSSRVMGRDCGAIA